MVRKLKIQRMSRKKELNLEYVDVQNVLDAINDSELENMTILELADALVKRAEDCQMEPDFFRKNHELISTLAERLKLTDMQAFFLAICLEFSENISIKDISRFLDCSKLKIVTYNDDFEALCKMHILFKDNMYSCKESFTVRKEVWDAFKANKAYKYQPVVGLDAMGVMCEFDTIFGKLREEDISSATAISDIYEILRNNRQVRFAQELLECEDLEDDDVLLLVFFCSALVMGGKVSYTNNITRKLFHDELCTAKGMSKELEQGSHKLLEKGLLEHYCSNGVAENSELCLSQKARSIFLSDYNINAILLKNVQGDVIKCQTIKKKELFYNEKEGAQIEQLGELIDDKRLKAVQRRLEEKGMRKGFACLFYGMPGTGKTETVYQLAKMTGRDIVEINVEKVKSKWVGESEQNIRDVFTNYRYLIQTLPKAPILLFNEADAILGKRFEGAEHAVDKMENSIQNIILQEMEGLEGIMIATTNLTHNLDKAFERRFIYKIEFGKPDVISRARIWRAMLPMLTEEEAATLAKQFNYTGGQIENIARKQTIREIIDGRTASFGSILSACHDETIAKERRTIGFI